MNVLSIFNGSESHEVGTIERDGARYWSAQDIAKAAGSDKRVRVWIKSKRTAYKASGLGIDKPAITRKGNFAGGTKQGTWIHEELVADFINWLDYDFNCTPSGEPREIDYNSWVNTQLEGKPEYRLPSGRRVDIITDTHVIEIKEADRLSSAIGQVLTYAAESNLQPMIILFNGDANEYTLRAACNCGITLACATTPSTSEQDWRIRKLRDQII